MYQARFWESAEDQKVQCYLCAQECKIDPGKRGLCHVRENQDGTLYSLNYAKSSPSTSTPLRKSPCSTSCPAPAPTPSPPSGCNFMCLHCQNYDISQYPRVHGGKILGDERDPEAIVAYALGSHSASISYTYTEPTIFLEYAQDVARLAREHNLNNVFVSNGFMTEASATALAEFVDADNVDLKSMRDDFYRKVCKARLQPVLDTIARLKKLGVWMEVTTLIIPGHNDSTAELTEIANFIKGVSPAIPWHVTAFHPTFKMMDRPATPVATLVRAREIGLKAGLRYVYVGNIPGEDGENTYCYACRELLIERLGYTIRRYHLKDGAAPSARPKSTGSGSSFRVPYSLTIIPSSCRS